MRSVIDHAQNEFSAETDAVEYLVARLEPHYTLHREVQIEHFDGSRMRVDLIALPRNRFARINSHRCIGIEIKAGYAEGKNFIRALQQCIDYRHSRIIDKRSNAKRGMTPDLVLLFPDFQPANGPYYNSEWRAGLIRLAGRFNVGTIQTSFNPWAKRLETRFEVAATRVWDDARGATGLRDFGTARKRGSQ